MPRRRAKVLTGRAGVRVIEHNGEKVFYRVTGYRDQNGAWVSRDPDNGHWYRRRDGSHPGKPPTARDLARSERVNIELERGGEVRHFAIDGDRLRALLGL